MLSKTKKILIAFFTLTMSVFINACQEQNDADSKKNHKKNKKVDYSKILSDVQDQVFATLEYSVGIDSLKFDIILHNNSKYRVFYPSLQFVINDIYPIYAYIPRGLNNCNLINILPCGINAEDSMLDISINDDDISPYYYSILSRDSLGIRFAIPFANYVDRYHAENSTQLDFNCIDVDIYMFIVINDMLARKFSAPSESDLVEYSSFHEYQDRHLEAIFFNQSEMQYSNSDYNDFHRSSFVIQCDTILDIEAIYNTKIGVNSIE